MTRRIVLAALAVGFTLATAACSGETAQPQPGPPIVQVNDCFAGFHAGGEVVAANC